MFSVLLGGDVIVNRPSSAGVLDGISSVAAESDVFFANLEGALTNETKSYRWRPGSDERYWDADGGEHVSLGMKQGSPEVVHDLSVLSAVTLANNHMMDYGVEGLLDTLAALDQAKIGHVGGGRNWEEATRPYIAERNGEKVALLTYTSVFNDGWGAAEDPGLAIFKVHFAYEPPRRGYEVRQVVHTWVDENVLEYVERDIASAREQADVVVMAFHWGQSRSGGEGVHGAGRELSEFQTQLGRFAIDAGATIVHGVHPHFIGPLEIYKGCPIFYSVGHLVFDTLETVKASPIFNYIHGNDTFLARCLTDHGRVARLEIFPASPDESNSPRLRTGSEGEVIARKLLEYPGTRDLDAVWDGSKLTIELAD